MKRRAIWTGLWVAAAALIAINLVGAIVGADVARVHGGPRVGLTVLARGQIQRAAAREGAALAGPDRGAAWPEIPSPGSSDAVRLLYASLASSLGILLLSAAALCRTARERRALARLRLMDPLTGVTNRAAFHDALAQAVVSPRPEAEFAVFSIDLDKFGEINESLGHAVGDALLRAVAMRLQSLVRTNDTVARIGEDSFGILMTRIRTPNAASVLAERIRTEFAAPITIGEQRLAVSATIGIALGRWGGPDAGQLLRRAELALAHAKQHARGTHSVFDPTMSEQAQARRQLALDLRTALAREEFELFFQPLISVRSRRVACMEALIRWHHPDRGLLGPGEFIAFAEQSGFIVPIGAWVLSRACREAMSWPDTVAVAVNISAAHFATGDVLDDVRRALAASNLPGGRLEVEITESALLNDCQRTMEALHALRAMGVRISMDDFGTGYSSLSYLRSFPFDKLKIDGSFVRDLGTSAESAAIIRAIAGMGHSLGMATTAEGVETEQQLSALVSEGCTEAQGFLLGRPCSTADTRKILSAAAHQAA